MSGQLTHPRRGRGPSLGGILDLPDLRGAATAVLELRTGEGEERGGRREKKGGRRERREEGEEGGGRRERREERGGRREGGAVGISPIIIPLTVLVSQVKLHKCLHTTSLLTVS